MQALASPFTLTLDCGSQKAIRLTIWTYFKSFLFGYSVGVPFVWLQPTYLPCIVMSKATLTVYAHKTGMTQSKGECCKTINACLSYLVRVLRMQ